MSHVVFPVLGILALALLVGIAERGSPEATAGMVREANLRRESRPEEIAYWRRHERNQAACRGQRYVYSCCDSSWDVGHLTCVSMEQKSK